MRNVTAALFCVVTIGWLASPAAAQPLGTFRWQLQPYCNVVSLSVFQNGGIYRLEGTDDQCGAPTLAAVTGLAFLNPNGSIGFGLTLAGSAGGAPQVIDTNITIATLSGTWRDSAGNAGTFTFTPGAGTGGSPRPTPTHAAVQFRVEGDTGQPLPNNVRTDLLWHTLVFNDGGGTYDAATGIYTVPSSGLYIISASAATDNVGAPGAGTYRFITLHVNGAIRQQSADEASDTWQTLSLVAMRKLNAGDQVKMSLLHNLGAGLESVLASDNFTHFSVVKLR